MATSNEEVSLPAVELLGMGNPLLDIISNVNHEFLDKYGLKLDNAILAEEKHMSMYQELSESKNLEYIAGGATQNTIRIAQWMCRRKGVTGFMGAIGRDDNGRILKDCAEADGVQIHYMVDSDAPTGVCGVLVESGERSLVANLSAANLFKVSHIDTPKAEAFIESAKVIYISGFFLTVSKETIEKVATRAMEKLKVFCMNLSAPFIIQFFRDALASVMPYTDFIFCNESEAEAYGQVKGFGSDLEEVALSIAAEPKASGTRARTVVITQGSKSTIVAQDGIVRTFPVDPLDKSLLVDSNGAGDAFVGGFLAMMLKNEPLQKCVNAGHWASRMVIQRSGCTFPQVCDYSD